MVQAKKSRKAKRVIPGFGLSLGVTITLLSLVVLIPLAALVIYTAQMSPSEFWEAITRERVLASYKVSFITAFIASLINAVMGVILAWVLVRYKFPGKRILDGMIELPFALPTAVAGIALTSLTADTGLIGGFFAKFGISIAYTRVGITVALVFVGIPFVTRAVQPVLEKLDPVYEEAAGVMGVILAWVLVRYKFPGKRILDGMIELPFALPTAVAGIALTSLTADTGLIGGFFAKFGISIAYTRVGITVALVFVGIPFVTRAVQPVLEKLDPVYEEAAGVMGAGRFRIFRKIILPEILPSVLTGFGLAFGRCLGEYGSVVFIAGNKPFETEITPLIIMSELQEYDYKSATAIALVMLAASFLILFLVNMVQHRNAKILKGGR